VFQRRGVLWLKEYYFSEVEKGIRRIESGPRFADKVRVFIESRGGLRFAESRVKLGLMFWELATADSGVKEVGAEVGVATARKIRRAGLSVRVVGGFEVGV
jgi:hypothetical protein